MRSRQCWLHTSTVTEDRLREGLMRLASAPEQPRIYWRGSIFCRDGGWWVMTDRRYTAKEIGLGRSVVMTDQGDTCPHCSHAWIDHHGGYCHCGCRWNKPEPPPEPPKPPTVTDVLYDALWSGFAAADNCFTDPKLDVIDTSGNYESFDMRQVAEHVLRFLTEHGYTITGDGDD